MLTWTVFLICVYYANICNGQFLQPRKFIEKVLDLHERSRNVLSGGDSMKLNVDLSSAKDFPIREDLRLRVFNKDNNITMCDTKLFDHVDAGQFPCSFDENAAYLKHGANNFELEVYSDINWKIYATQKIPDIHYFDSFSYEGYYDNFIDARDTEGYVKKTIATSVFSLLVAHLVTKGPAAITDDFKYIISDVIGRQMMLLASNLAAVSSAGLISAANSMIFLATAVRASGIFLYDIFSSGLASPYGMILSGSGILASQLATLPRLGYITSTNGIIYLMTAMKASAIFLYDIFSSGLASPYSMLLSGSSALGTLFIRSLLGSLKMFRNGSESFFTFLFILFSDSSKVISVLTKALSNGSKGAFLGLISAFSYLMTSMTSNSQAAFKQLVALSFMGASAMMKLPKSSVMLLLASGQFVFDIFSAGLSSPAGMISSGSQAAFKQLVALSFMSASAMMKLPKSSVMLLLASGQFVFDIFSAGLSSPAGMISSGSQAAFKQLVALSFMSASAMMKLPKSSAMLLLASGQFVFDIFSAGLSSPAGMISSGSQAAFKQLVALSIMSARAMMKLPKSSVMLLLASGQFVFDIFSAGLSSPAGMISSGATSFGLLLSKMTQNTIKNIFFSFALLSSTINPIIKKIVSNLWKSSDLLSSNINGMFRQLNIISVLLNKQTNLLFISLFKLLKNGPKTFLPNMMKFSSFLFDLFRAGLASPGGMLRNGLTLLAQIVTLSYLSSCRETSIVCKTIYNIILKSYKNMLKSSRSTLVNCGTFLFGGTNGLLGFLGYKGITRKYFALLSIFLTFFDSLQKNLFDMIFIDSNLSSGGGGGGGGGGSSGDNKMRSKFQSNLYKNNSPVQYLNKNENKNLNLNFNEYEYENLIPKKNILYQSEINNIQISKSKVKRINKSYLSTAGLFAAFFLLSPTSKKIIPGFSEIRERMKVNSVQTSLSKSSEKLTQHIIKQKSKQNVNLLIILQKNIFAFNSVVRNIFTNNVVSNYLLKNKKLNEEIPSGCPLRRAGLF